MLVFPPLQVFLFLFLNLASISVAILYLLALWPVVLGVLGS